MAAMTSPLDLLGHWSLDRTVEDRLTDETRRVVGETTLTLLDDGRIRWDETGTMRWAWNEVPVSRTLYVEPRDEGWFVTFEDGRDFHPWATGTRVDHACSPDHYSGVIQVDDDGWSVEWAARGPAKDYTMLSRLSRS